MSEPAVALTDYALAIETAVLTMLLQRRRRTALQFWLSLYFASVSVASLCGGTVHGFASSELPLIREILWPTTLLAIGATALATWSIAAELLDSRPIARLLRIAAVVQAAVYAVVVLVFSTAFWTAIAVNLPATLFLLGIVGYKYGQQPRRPLLLAAAGLLLSLVAAGLQQAGVGFHPVHFDHNAVYHVIQLVALYLFYRGGIGFLDQEAFD